MATAPVCAAPDSAGARDDEVTAAARAAAAHRRGLAAFGRGDHAAAVAAFTEAVRDRPDYAEAYNGRGVAHYCLRDFAAAVADLSIAVELAPGYAEAFNNRGLARKALGDADGALADYDHALQLEPQFAQTYNNRGTLRQARKDFDGALADYDRAVELHPTYAEAYENRAGLRAARWRHAEAAADFDRALGLYRHSALPPARLCGLLVGRGDARYHSGDPHGLLTDYHAALQMHTDVAVTMIVRRVADDLRSARPAVLANCRKHLRQSPTDPATCARWSLVCALSGNDAEAAAQFERFRSLTPQYAAHLALLLTEARRNRPPSGAADGPIDLSACESEPEREPGCPA